MCDIYIRKEKSNRMMHAELLAVYNDTFLFYQNGDYIFSNRNDFQLYKKNRYISLWDRISRKFFFSSVWINKTQLCLNFDRKFFLVDFDNQSIEDIALPYPIKSLRLFLCNNKNDILFSPYGLNKKLGEIPIFKFDVSNRDIKIIASFDSGLINHVHSFYQLNNNQVYANVGDQIGTMGAWEINLLSGSVRPALLNDDFRSVICEPLTSTNWITISDIPSGKNFVQIFDGSPFNGKLKVKIPIDGAVIYGQKTQKAYYFAVSGEPFHPTLFNCWLMNLEQRDCSLFRINYDNYKIERVIFSKKDKLPYSLFGLGNFTFIPSKSNEVIWLRINGISMHSIKPARNTKIDLEEDLNVARMYI